MRRHFLRVFEGVRGDVGRAERVIADRRVNAGGRRIMRYKGYRFPPEIIQQSIWLYLRFTLSFRDVEDLLAERGIMVSHETVRRWVNHFGPVIATCANADPSPIRLGIWTRFI